MNNLAVVASVPACVLALSLFCLFSFCCTSAETQELPPSSSTGLLRR